jgi:chromosome segregation ATPase
MDHHFITKEQLLMIFTPTQYAQITDMIRVRLAKYSADEDIVKANMLENAKRTAAKLIENECIPRHLERIHCRINEQVDKHEHASQLITDTFHYFSQELECLKIHQERMCEVNRIQNNKIENLDYELDCLKKDKVNDCGRIVELEINLDCEKKKLKMLENDVCNLKQENNELKSEICQLKHSNQCQNDAIKLLENHVNIIKIEEIVEDHKIDEIEKEINELKEHKCEDTISVDIIHIDAHETC